MYLEASDVAPDGELVRQLVRHCTGPDVREDGKWTL